MYTIPDASDYVEQYDVVIPVGIRREIHRLLYSWHISPQKNKIKDGPARLKKENKEIKKEDTHIYLSPIYRLVQLFKKKETKNK